MKYLITTFIFLLLTAMSCKKNRDKNDQLPPTTQIGANTFGCLVNGEVYIPKGYSGTGTPNFRGIYEFFNGSPYLKIITERYENNSFNGEIYFNIDSLDHEGLYHIRANKNRIVFGGHFFNGCWISGFDTISYQKGAFLITRLDLQNGIISGTFNCKIKPDNCDTLNITEGRFDLKL